MLDLVRPMVMVVDADEDRYAQERHATVVCELTAQVSFRFFRPEAVEVTALSR